MRHTHLSLQRLEDRATPATFTVTTIADSGAGSLRQAILDANAAAGLDDIAFNIAGSGVRTIQLASQLPLLTGAVNVDGHTQPGSSPNTLAVGDNAVILIEVLGGGGAAAAFAQLPSGDLSNSTFRGLSLGNFGAGAIAIGTANNVRIIGNFLGVRPDGVTTRANATGITIEGGSGHHIGSINPADRNLISGNTGNGLSFATDGVFVLNNYIGTTASGAAKLGNGAAGVTFQSSGNFIGGHGTGMGNVISGNGTHGVWARNSSNTNIAGNRIGTDATGTVALGNGQDGVNFTAAGNGNLIGGGYPESRNVISGNGNNGITIEQTGANTIMGNYVGTNAAGTAAVPNGRYGLVSSGPVAVGGQSLDNGNLVSGNAAGGMVLRGQSTAGYNRVGTDVTGNNPLPNGGPGVLTDQPGGTLGGTAGPNVIAFNTGPGVAVQFPALHVRINGNSIHDNNGLGIDLIGDSNDQMRPPALTGTTVNGAAVAYAGTLSGPVGNYRIEFFANPAGGDEGQAYIGFTTVTVGASGPATFAPVLNAPPTGFTSITATATRESTGSTSEFSAPIALGSVPNTPPTITTIADQVVLPGTTSAPLTFTVSDAESPATALVVTAASSVGSVVPLSGIVVGGTGAARTVTVTPATFVGKATTTTITLTVADPSGAMTATSFLVSIRESGPSGPSVFPNNPVLLGRQKYAIGSDRGGPPEVQLRDQDGSLILSKQVFDPTFTGGVRTVAGDINCDGYPDLIAAAGPGGPPTVVVIDGKTGTELRRFNAFEPSFTGGLFVTTADFDRDGCDDLIITPDEGGGPRVQVRSGKDDHTLADFFGIDDPNFRGGCRAAAADVSGDGTPDLLVAAGFGGGPRLAGFDGATVVAGSPVRLFGDFFVFEPTLRNGVYVTCGDLNADGYADIIVGGGPGGGPRVMALDGKRALANAHDPIANFFAGDVSSRGGVRLAVKDLDNDVQADLVTAAGPGDGSMVRRYAGKNLGQANPQVEATLEAIPGFNGGVYVG